MSRDSHDHLPTVGLQPLSKHEIDLQLQRMACELATGAIPGSDPETEQPEETRPALITPAELVRRVRPFLVYN